MAALMASRCVRGMEATFSTTTSVLTSGLLLLARYHAVGMAKKWWDCAPASPSLPACLHAAA
eukprot:2406703-Pyramimonas_sp.AAC.1